MRKRVLCIVKILLVSSVFVLLGSSSAWTAQSSADVVVDEATKEALRQEIVGTAQKGMLDKAYTIGYGDILSVSVYGEGNMAVTGTGQSTPSLTGGVGTDVPESQARSVADGIEVHLDGTISLLHIGDIRAVGMTTAQLADYLKKLYSSVFADPIITVTLVQSNSRRYTVMGKVNNPGIFHLDFPVTAVQAVARSGGFTEWASHEVSVIRQGSGESTVKGSSGKNTVIKFDYDDFLKGKGLDKNVYIQANDVVIVH
jgi:polysaccharide export outer membrane protein